MAERNRWPLARWETARPGNTGPCGATAAPPVAKDSVQGILDIKMILLLWFIAAIMDLLLGPIWLIVQLFDKIKSKNPTGNR